jgi:transposase-like protein
VRPVFEEAAMLIELSMVEQRYLAVREALDSGATIVQVAAQYGVDRRTLKLTDIGDSLGSSKGGEL